MAKFSVLGPIWGVLGDSGAQNRYFFSFFEVTSPLRAGVEIFGATSHLLNVSSHRRRLVRRTVERLARWCLFHFSCEAITSRPEGAERAVHPLWIIFTFFMLATDNLLGRDHCPDLVFLQE